MPRQPRFRIPDLPQYVMQRGDPAEPVFVEESDFQVFLECLEEAAKSSGSTVHAYALLPSEVRLLATPTGPDGIPRLMQSLGRRYAQHTSARASRGPLWESRYRAGLVEPGRLVLACYRHIEDTPVRAGLATEAGHYAWTSRRHNTTGARGRATRPHPMYEWLGLDGHERATHYRALCAVPLSGGVVREIDRAVDRCLVLGSDAFKDGVASRYRRQVRPGRRGRPKKWHDPAGKPALASSGASGSGVQAANPSRAPTTSPVATPSA